MLVAALLVAPPLQADPVDDISRQLVRQGFEVREVGRTWLGRIRIIAETDTLRREIVFDRTTGEIRRDYVTERRAPRAGANDLRDARDAGRNDSRSGGASQGGGNSGRGGDRDDDDDDDDDGDDDSDDDDEDDGDDRGGRGGGGGDSDDDDDDDDD